MRYRLIKPDWAKLPESEGGISGENSIDIDNASQEFLDQKNKEGYGVYYFPNYNSKPFHGNFLAGKNVDVFEWVYVDMDLKDGVYPTTFDFINLLLNYENTPNFIVESGNGVHAYWKVSDLTRERFCELQMKLIKHFKTDHSIWTVLRCMRYPGSFNTKDKNNFKEVTKTETSEELYTYMKLVPNLPELNAEEETKIVNHLRKVDGLDEIADLDDIDISTLPESFLKLMGKNPMIKGLFEYDKQGKRSDKAYALGNSLYELDFPRKEAIAVIAQTPKARTKGQGALGFAASMVAGIYEKKSPFMVKSALQKSKEGQIGMARKGRQLQGPEYFVGLLDKPWRTQQCLGLVGGSGIGKSTVTLDIFRAIMENHPEADDICVYFNLEMTDWEVIEKWEALTDSNPKLAERLYVVSNEDDDGNPRNINLQQIHWFCRDIQKATGKKIVAIAIDHIGVINPTIDITKKPDFGMAGDMENSFGNLRNVSPRKMPDLIKQLAKQLDTFIIIQSQTTKAKGMDGDTPLGIDAAYGAAQFEQYMDYVITLWQPIRRVYHKTPLRIVGWQYCKIRHKSVKDDIQAYQRMAAKVDLHTGRLYCLSAEEEFELDVLNNECEVLRKKAEKKGAEKYTNSKGTLSKLKAIFSKAN